VRLIGGEIRKLLRRPASFITLGIQLAIVIVVYLAVAASFRAAGQGSSGGDTEARTGIRLLLTFPGAYGGW